MRAVLDAGQPLDEWRRMCDDTGWLPTTVAGRMEGSGMKRAIIAVACVVVATFAAYSLWPRGRPSVTAEMVKRPRVCEACGHRFDGPTEAILIECPKCGKRAAARVYYYVCRGCGERFEAFQERPADPSLTKVDPLRPPELVYKRGEGEWVPFAELGEIVCPKCGSANVGAPRPK